MTGWWYIAAIVFSTLIYVAIKLLFYTKKITPQVEPTVGAIGTVYTPFLGGTKSATIRDSCSCGTVQMTAGDRSSIINGLCEENLPSFADVKIIEVLDSNLVKVERI